MNRSKFLQDKRDGIDNSLNMLHQVILRMLKIVSHICEDQELNFWLEYGTLLGAIRHKGFIPWDTEADIGMLRSDFNKLCMVAPSELPDDIFFQNKHSDSDYSMNQFIEAKFRDKYSNYTSFRKNNPNLKWHNGIQIDIFVFDPLILNGEKCLVNKFEKYLTNCKSYYRLEEIEETIECDFEDTKFFVPLGYQSYLERNYGNYMEPPPVEERIPEEFDLYNPCDHSEILYWK